MNTTYIEPHFVDKIIILESEQDLLKYVDYFSKCPRPTKENEEDFFAEMWITSKILLNKYLFEELRYKYDKDFYEVFGGAKVLIINDIAIEEITAPWEYPNEIIDDYHKKITKDCNLFAVYHYNSKK